MCGLGFQHAARYQVEARRTWLATRILPARESLLLLHVISLPLRVSIIFSKLDSRGRWKPTWIPRYCVPDPFGSHRSPTSSPHDQVLSDLLA